MEQLWAGTGSASLEWGAMLVVLLKGGLVVTDVSVVHSVATSFVRCVAHEAGAAASARDESTSAGMVEALR
jgi:hypothetical protein